MIDIYNTIDMKKKEDIKVESNISVSSNSTQLPDVVANMKHTSIFVKGKSIFYFLIAVLSNA